MRRILPRLKPNRKKTEADTLAGRHSTMRRVAASRDRAGAKYSESLSASSRHERACRSVPSDFDYGIRLAPNPHRRAPAKINLTLHVTGRRADGWHTLEVWSLCRAEAIRSP